MPQPAPTEDWWTPDQIELVEDRSRSWREVVFEPQDAVAESQGGGGLILRQKVEGEQLNRDERIVPKGWGHEHCSLCWETISPQEGEQHFGYTDGDRWLCTSCYLKYIVPREVKS